MLEPLYFFKYLPPVQHLVQVVLSRPVAALTVCLHCLEEMAEPIDKAAYESVLMSCAQNIHAAHCMVINDQLCLLTLEMDEWVSAHHDSIKHDFISAVITDDASSLHKPSDPHLQEWADHTKCTFRSAAKHFIVQMIVEDTIDPWLIEYFQAIKASADQHNKEHFTNYNRNMHASTEKQANKDSDDFYSTTLASLKAEALECAEREVAKYKSVLKIAAEEQKAKFQADLEKCLVKVSKSSKPTNPADWPLCTKLRVDPTTRPLPPS